MRYAMDGISWSDLDPDEQRTIAMLGAGVSAELCDPVAVLTLTRLGLVKGSSLSGAKEIPGLAPSKNKICGPAALAFGLGLVAGAGKVRPGITPFVGKFRGPDEIWRPRHTHERIGRVVGDVRRETELAVFFKKTCEPS